MRSSSLYFPILFLLSTLLHPVFFIQVYSQEYKTSPLAFSLLQAQEYAFEHNYDLQNSAKDVEIARKMVKQNTAIGLPQINANIDYMDYINMPTTIIPNFLPDTTGIAPKTLEVQFGMKYNMTAKATLTQLIYSGQYLVGLQTAKAYLETTRQKYIKDKVDVRILVTDGYYQLLVVDEAMKILDSIYVVISKLLKEVRESYKAGLIEDIDVDQAELNQFNLEAQINDTRNARNLAYARLKFIMGLKDDQEMVLTDNLKFFLDQVNRDALLSRPFDYRTNIDFIMLKKSDYLILMQYKLAKTAYQPTLAGFLGVSENAQRNSWTFFNTDQKWYNTTNWGLSLNIPIWSSGNRKFAVDQARLNVEKTKITDEKVRVGLELQVETAKKDFNNAYLVYQNKEKGFRMSLKIYEKTMEKYKLGIASSTDLNQRYSQFLQANNDFMLSIYTVLAMQTKLNKLLEQF
jgi:outer membrane protein TolC